MHEICIHTFLSQPGIRTSLATDIVQKVSSIVAWKVRCRYLHSSSSFTQVGPTFWAILLAGMRTYLEHKLIPKYKPLWEKSE